MTVKTIPFQGVRIEVETRTSFDTVIQRLREQMGDATVREVVKLAKEPISQEAFVDRVNKQFVGASGFMVFAEFDHGGWLTQFGLSRRTVRWVIGNPLIAITMIRHDITAGLFAPVEFLVTEAETGAGAAIAYVRPSSLMVVRENPPLLEAAKALDEKLDALIAKATVEENEG
jgi:uncharacterized protein (DUF302 family)